MKEAEHLRTLLADGTLDSAIEGMTILLNRVLKYPEKKWWERGFVTGSAEHIQRLQHVRVHVWVDPRMEGYTFTNEFGMVPVMRMDLSLTARDLATFKSPDAAIEFLYKESKKELDLAEAVGSETLGIKPGTKS